MPVMKPSIAVVLFDAVGTLMYPRPSVAQVYAACGRRQGARVAEETLSLRFPAALAEFTRDFEQPCTAAGERMRWRKIVARVFEPERLSAEQVEAIFDELWQHFSQPASWALYDDVAAPLVELAKRGFRLGVASNFDERLEPICRGLPALAPCRELFPVTRVGFAKPFPGYYTRVAELLATSPEQVLLVGDDPKHDVHAAQRAGWQALLLDRGAKEKPSGEQMIRSLDELPPLLAVQAVGSSAE